MASALVAIQRLNRELPLGRHSLPWMVLRLVQAEDPPVLRAHFLAPVEGATKRLVTERLPLEIGGITRFTFSERAPLCTVHTDCWEAGEEMRRSYFAAVSDEGASPATLRPSRDDCVAVSSG